MTTPRRLGGTSAAKFYISIHRSKADGERGAQIRNDATVLPAGVHRHPDDMAGDQFPPLVLGRVGEHLLEVVDLQKCSRQLVQGFTSLMRVTTAPMMISV